MTDLDLPVWYPSPTACLDTDRQREAWVTVRAGEGGVQSSSYAIKFGAVHSCLTYDWPRGLPYLSQLIAQVYRANIGLQVSDAIVDRLREGTNKHCLVKWQIVKEEGGGED